MSIGPKRTEKLVSALYLLTSFFDDKEPMKWRLRELGNRLISRNSEGALVLEIIGLLTVAKNAGLVSDTNFEIIHREFSATLPQGQTLGEIFTALPDREPQRTIAPVAKPVERQEKPTMYLSSSVRSEQPVKDKIVREPRETGVVAIKKNSRQNVILSLLKKKKEIMVKDVSPLIEGVSEKTIQRELLSMVSKGILRKEGEKRWSRYSLAEE